MITPLSVEEVESRGLYPRTYHAAVLPLPLERLVSHYGLEVASGDDDGLGPYQVAFAEHDGVAFAANQHEYDPSGEVMTITVGPAGMNSAAINALVGELSAALGVSASWQVEDEIADELDPLAQR